LGHGQDEACGTNAVMEAPLGRPHLDRQRGPLDQGNGAAGAGMIPAEHLKPQDMDVLRPDGRRGGADHAAGILDSTIPAYQLAPKGMTLSSKL
jgi:hypothetical protein